MRIFQRRLWGCKCIQIYCRKTSWAFLKACYSKTCVREPPSRLTLNSGRCGKSCLSYTGTCHVILLAKLHDMYLYKTTTFPHQPLRSKVAVLHRFYCIHIVFAFHRSKLYCTSQNWRQDLFQKSKLYRRMHSWSLSLRRLIQILMRVIWLTNGKPRRCYYRYDHVIFMTWVISLNNLAVMW